MEQSPMNLSNKNRPLNQLTAKEVIDRFEMTTLEGEGGFWAPLERTKSSNSILFLTTEFDYSAWHRLNEDETWFHMAGAPLLLHTLAGKELATHTLDRNVATLNGDTRIQSLVSAGQWMAAESTGLWSLVVCSLTPAFTGMELATADDFEKMRHANSDIESLSHLLAQG
jgi:predicted cupin superfamily sugar epimerase